jgi:hypothetical protein
MFYSFTSHSYRTDGALLTGQSLVVVGEAGGGNPGGHFLHLHHRAPRHQEHLTRLPEQQQESYRFFLLFSSRDIQEHSHTQTKVGAGMPLKASYRRWWGVTFSVLLKGKNQAYHLALCPGWVGTRSAKQTTNYNNKNNIVYLVCSSYSYIFAIQLVLVAVTSFTVGPISDSGWA